jgi:hypothetical protein
MISPRPPGIEPDSEVIGLSLEFSGAPPCASTTISAGSFPIGESVGGSIVFVGFGGPV